MAGDGDAVVRAMQQLKAHLRFPVVKVSNQWWGGTVSKSSHQLSLMFPLIGNYAEIDPIEGHPRGGRAFDIMQIDGKFQVFDFAAGKLILMSDMGISYRDPSVWVYRVPKDAKWTTTILNPFPTGVRSHTLSFDSMLSEA